MLADRRPSADLRPADVRAVLDTAVRPFVAGEIGGIGIDVVDVVEFGHNAAVGGDRWLKKVFTPGELAFAAGRIEQLASRFAAKEAVVKSLGTGFRSGVAPRCVEIVTTEEGESAVALHGEAALIAADLGISEILVSMTREGSCAAAIACSVSSHQSGGGSGY